MENNKFNLHLDKYKTLVFDCDGVVLNSNKIKTEAFYEATKHYGEDEAQKLVKYHIQNGGISRYTKFEYFFTDILHQDVEQDKLNDLLDRFSSAIKNALADCEVAEGLEELREQTKGVKWLIVSGGDQEELREVFSKRGLDKHFDGGIFGSPDAKDIILDREKNNKVIVEPALFLGDSKYDYQAASNAKLDFLFLSDWSEVDDWQGFCDNNKLQSTKNLQVYIRTISKIERNQK